MQLGDLAGAGEDLHKCLSLLRVAFEPAARAALGDMAAASGDLMGAIAEYGKSIDVRPLESRGVPQAGERQAPARQDVAGRD